MNITPLKKPQFCFITPTAYLQQYACSSNVHLVLAHLVDTDEVYAQFYNTLKDQIDSSNFIIMDNGAFELGESYKPSELIRLGHKCGADVIVLPDYPEQQAQKTINAAKSVLNDIKRAGFKTMFVPQSEIGDLEGWIDGYIWAAKHPDIDMIGMSILAIPNALPNIPRAYARVVMTQILEDRDIFNYDKHHHYLGLNSGPNIEIPSLILSGHLDTCDSSNPIWCGINELYYDVDCMDYMVYKKSRLPHVDFDIAYNHSEDVHAAIKHNIEIVQDMFETPKYYL